MTLYTNHVRRDDTAHLWPEGAEKGDPALCGTEWRRGYGTLVALPDAGLGATLYEALEHADMCTFCKEEAIDHHNLPTHLKADAMSIKELAQAYLSAVEAEEEP